MLSDAFSTGLTNLLLLGLLLACIRWVHREGPASLLLHVDARGRHLFLVGAIAGLVAFAAYPAIVLLTGRGHFITSADGLRTTVIATIAWALAFLFVALFEEALFRGYLMRKMLRRFPRWVAIVVPSLLFGAIHILSYDLDRTIWLGLMNAALFGMVFSLMVIRGRSLMGAIGLHWAWNLAQKIILLQPEDGAETLFRLQLQDGPGASAQQHPELGLFVTGILLLLGVSLKLWLAPGSISRENEIL